MTKIFKRDTLISGVSPKKKDEKKRKRSVIVNFRMAPEEKKLLDNRIELSGMQRQDFFIQSCLYQKIITYGNIRTFDVMRKKVVEINKHLNSIPKSEELDLEILESLRMILEMLDGLVKEDGSNG